MAHKSVRGEKERKRRRRALTSPVCGKDLFRHVRVVWFASLEKRKLLECARVGVYSLTQTHPHTIWKLGSGISFCLNVFLSPFSNFRTHSGNFFSGLRWNDHYLWMGEIFRQISNKCLISSSEQWTGDWKIGIAMECLACSNSWVEISKGQRFVSLRLIQNKISINIKRTFSQIKPL